MKVQYVPNKVQGGRVKILVYWNWKVERGLVHGVVIPTASQAMVIGPCSALPLPFRYTPRERHRHSADLPNRHQ